MSSVLRRFEVDPRAPSEVVTSASLFKALFGYGTLLMQLLVTFWVATISSRDKTSWRWWGNAFVWSGLLSGFILILIRM